MNLLEITINLKWVYKGMIYNYFYKLRNIKIEINNTIMLNTKDKGFDEIKSSYWKGENLIREVVISCGSERSILLYNF